MLVILLEEEGHAVESAGEGREALEMFLRNPGMAFILSDMNMPVMDGLELTREIRKVDLEVPILLLTAHDDDSFTHKACESGVQRCLLNDEHLMDEIAGIVGQVLNSVPPFRKFTGLP
jgi:CheY-like chemotaxis protein